MKLLWRILRNLLGVVGFFIAYGSLAAELFEWRILGISWAWYALIGVSILLVALLTTIVSLFQDNRKLSSEEAELDRDIKRLQKKNLEWEALSHGNGL